MAKIEKVWAREILDSRGNPTVEVELTLDSGLVSRAAVPSGASTGQHEAHELRDEDPSRYHGKGVQKAVANIKGRLGEVLLGQDPRDWQARDSDLLSLDSSANKSQLGANTILGASLANARAGALASGLPLYRFLNPNSQLKLPVPQMNVLNGGAHADNGVDIQEFMLVPKGFDTFQSALRAGSEIFQSLKKILSHRSLSTTVGDEGGFAPRLESNEKALELLMEAIEKANYRPGEQVCLALDVAATEFFKDGFYHFEGRKIEAPELSEIYLNWTKKFPLISIEDGHSEDDWAGWVGFTEKVKGAVQLVGDDLFVTNVERLREGISKKAANAILIKVNQIGSLSETWETIQMAKEAQFATVMSHRSGETEDTTIADLSVAFDSDQIKTGSLSRGERTAKYNQLLRIEEELGDQAQFRGQS